MVKKVQELATGWRPDNAVGEKPKKSEIAQCSLTRIALHQLYGLHELGSRWREKRGCWSDTKSFIDKAATGW